MRWQQAVIPAIVLLPLAAIGLLGLFVLTSKDPDPVRPLPPEPAVPPAPGVTKDYDDATEDAVLEIEDMLIDFARQIRERAWGGAMYHVAEDFEGTPLLREPDGAAQTVGGVSLVRGGADTRIVNRTGFRESLDTLRVDELVFKIPSADFNHKVLQARLKLDAHRRAVAPGQVATRWVSEGEAEFVHRGRWMLRWFRGTDVRREDGAERFWDVTQSAGLRDDPGADEREKVRITFGRLFVGGIAAGDADGDGDVDLYVPRIGPNRFYRNDGGTFTECAAALGVDDSDTGASALFLDTDNDGDLDLLVTNYEPRQMRDRETGALADNAGRRALVLYRNDGARFTDVTERAGLRTRGPAMSACAADVDGDSDLDVYVCMYRDDSRDDPRMSDELPADFFRAQDGEPDQLWINQGDGTFKEEGAARGAADPGWGLAAGFADYDGDGDPDLCVANDYGDKRLYRNRGDGTFEDVAARAGAADTGFGMGVLWFDYDGDGHLDLYISNMYSTAGNRILSRSGAVLPPEGLGRLRKMAAGNTLLRNRGDGTFADVTRETGVGRAGWAWSSAAFDYDNDGAPDLYVANGFRTSAFATSDL